MPHPRAGLGSAGRHLAHVLGSFRPAASVPGQRLGATGGLLHSTNTSPLPHRGGLCHSQSTDARLRPGRGRLDPARGQQKQTRNQGANHRHGASRRIIRDTAVRTSPAGAQLRRRHLQPRRLAQVENRDSEHGPLREGCNCRCSKLFGRPSQRSSAM